VGISFSDKANMNSMKVFLVIEVPLIGNILASVLEDEPNIKVAGSVTSLRDALEFIAEQEVNVVLVSVGLPDHDALTLTRTIVDRTPSTKVLILGLSDEDKNSALRYIEAGAAGYVLKDSSLKEFIEIIRLTQKGEAQVSTKIAGAMMERLSNLARMFSTVEHRIDGAVRLTSRELEVLQYIGEGLTNQEIATRLVVEVGTVKNHVHSILEKLKVSSRDEAASYLAFIKR
jgi:DNA-binding NarL/FixJ family response regulator